MLFVYDSWLLNLECDNVDKKLLNTIADIHGRSHRECEFWDSLVHWPQRCDKMTNVAKCSLVKIWYLNEWINIYLIKPRQKGLKSFKSIKLSPFIHKYFKWWQSSLKNVIHVEELIDNIDPSVHLQWIICELWRQFKIRLDFKRHQ